MMVRYNQILPTCKLICQFFKAAMVSRFPVPNSHQYIPKPFLTCMLRKILHHLHIDNIVNQRFLVWFSPDHGTNQRRNKRMNDMYSINPSLVLYVGRLLFNTIHILSVNTPVLFPSNPGVVGKVFTKQTISQIDHRVMNPACQRYFLSSEKPTGSRVIAHQHG